MIYKFLHKYGLAIAFALAAIAGLIGVMSIRSSSIGFEEAQAKAAALESVQKIKDPDAKNELTRKEAYNFLSDSQRDGVGAMVTWAVILVILGGLISVAFPLVKSMSNPKSLLRFGIGAGVLGILVLMGYNISSTAVQNVDEDLYTQGEAQFSGGIVVSIVVLVVLALIGMLGGEVYRLIKERL